MRDELLKYLLENTGKPRGITWIELAQKFEIAPEKSDKGRGQAAFDIWRRFLGTKRGLELKYVTLDKNGEVAFKRIGRAEEPKTLPDTEGLELKFMTKTPNGGAFVRYEPPKLGMSNEDIKNLIKSFIETPIIPIKEWKREKGKEKILYTIGDVHVGMDSKDNIFGLDWNKEKLMERADVFLSHVEDAETMIVFGGDITDGLDGFTTRKRHKLPQNLNNKEQLEVAKDFVLKIIDGVSQKTNCKIKVTWCSNSNHGGILDFAIGVILKEIAPRWGGQVSIVNQEKFIDAYEFFGTPILITHGYDEEYMPKGFGRYLGNSEINFVEKIIEHHNISKPILLRFDQHVWHSARQVRFTDILCPSFSSQSSWVSINFASDYQGGFMKLRMGDGMTPKIIDFENTASTTTG